MSDVAMEDLRALKVRVNAIWRRNELLLGEVMKMKERLYDLECEIQGDVDVEVPLEKEEGEDG